MLAELGLKEAFRSKRDALLDDFYIPCLQESITYDRAVGYFSSSLIHVMALAFSDFVARGGRMRLICSPALSVQDFDAMRAGADLADAAQSAVKAEVDEMLSDPISMSATRLLATLIASQVLDVQVASVTGESGIFHDKLGIFTDSDGKRVTFVGSANETWAAWGLNHESFEVFCSWKGESDLLRTRRHAEEFERLWINGEIGVHVEPLDGLTRSKLIEVAEDDVESALQLIRQGKPSGPTRIPMPHQKAVLEDWSAHGFRGIVSFATGAGKTITALNGIRDWTSDGRPAIILVPGRELHHQWNREIQLDIPNASILKCGAGAGADTWANLLAVFTQPRSPISRPRITLATNATFASEGFQTLVRDGGHLLVVADEMHRMGSPGNLAALAAMEPGGRLGLSATYSRQFDESGTEALVNWFGPVLEPVIGLAEATLLGLLVPYDYRLHTLQLEPDEVAKYEDLTDKIRVSSIMSQESGEMSDSLKMMLIRRSRILKQARGKAPMALEILAREYESGSRWLVYCDDIEQLEKVVAGGLRLHLPVLAFHSGMAGDREAALQSFTSNGGILVAIRCLDEGIDIPSCDQALILASSTVSREYIQRRGRVLRRAPGKFSAVVHDLLLVNDAGGVLTKNEAIRALEFARLSRNPSAKAVLNLLIALSPDIDVQDNELDQPVDSDEEG